MPTTELNPLTNQPVTLTPATGTTATQEGIFLEYPNPDGTVEKITLAEAQNRLKTYSGKAKSFDAKAAEAAELKAKWEADKAVADKFRRQQELMEKVNTTNDPDAFRELGKELGLSGEYIEEQLAAFAGATGTQGAAGGTTTTASSLSPQDRALLQQVREMLQGFQKNGVDPVKDILGVREFQRSTTKNWAKDIVQKHLTNDPILGKIVSNPTKGQTILEDVWRKVDEAVESGKKSFSFETIQEVVKPYHDFANAFDEAFPQNQLHPGAFGSAPTATSGSRLTAPKKPEYKDYPTSKEGFSRYMSDLIQYEQYAQRK